MKYDKINGDVGFLEGPHKYVNLKDDSINYTSVTTMIEKYGADFDSDFWSKYKALEKLIDPSDFKIEKKSLLKTKRFDMRILDAWCHSGRNMARKRKKTLSRSISKCLIV